MRDRRKEDDARRTRAVVLLLEQPLDVAVEVGFELGQAILALERFVVAEEGEDDVGLGFGEPFVGAAEAGGAQARGQLVAGIAEVAKDEVVLGKARVEIRLEPAVMLHAFGERIADDADVVAFLQDERAGVSERCCQ